MAEPTYFTVEADYQAVSIDTTTDVDADPSITPISATVTFRPLIADGDAILATTAEPRPTGFVAAPIVASIGTDGRLKLRSTPDGTKVTAANYAALPGTGDAGSYYVTLDDDKHWRWNGSGYTEILPYQPVRLLADTDLLELDGPLFYNVEFSNVIYNGRVGRLNGFNFQAPTSDTTVNLIEVGRAAGETGQGIAKAVVSVGTTTTGAPGSAASVTNSGSPVAAVLDFTIPQGVKGDKGDTGTPGSAIINDFEVTETARAVLSTPQSPAVNYWYKISSVTAPPYLPAALLLAINTLRGNGTNSTIIVSMYCTDNVPSGGGELAQVSILAASGTHFDNDSVKVTNNGEGTPYEIWVKCLSAATPLRVTEISRNFTNAANSVVYHTNGAWQPVEPAGSVFNVKTSGVTAFGQPVVTTTAAQALTNKTLTGPTIDNARTNNIRDLSGKSNISVDNPYSRLYLTPGGKAGIEILKNDNGVNFLLIQAASTGYPVYLAATGTDANVGLNLVTKGSGVVYVNNIPVVTTTGAQALTNKTLTTPTIEVINGTNGGPFLKGYSGNAAGSNHFVLSGTNTGNPVYFSARGDDANITMYVQAKGSGGFVLRNDNGTSATFGSFPNSVNRIEFYGRETGQAPILSANGTDTNVSLNLTTKGSGTVKANGVDVVTTTGAQALTNKTLTNPKVDIIRDSTNNEILEFVGNSSSVNHVRINNQPTGGSPIIAASGDDANIGLNLMGKGSGAVFANSVPVVTRVSSVPATATSAGVTGQMAWDASYVYVCIATNTWRRAALSSW